MKTDQYSASTTVFLQTVSDALRQLKQQLQHDYERTYPSLREVVHLVLDEEETNAWALSLFPHLVFPDLVEAHIARLNLQPAETKHDDIGTSHRSSVFPTLQPSLALCG
jgi:hypothetical protein